jgi:eukaryotic-like serine/threonine-protein kinase
LVCRYTQVSNDKANPCSQEFARKLIRLFERNQEDIDREIANEVRVIEKLSQNGGHPNIISVFQHGRLKTNQYYFFDMELCAMNLGDYILADFKTVLGSQYLNPIQTTEDLSCLSLWNIMRQITNGLEYIHSHGELHRDLKPCNGMGQYVLVNKIVLLSVTDNAWKITNFGLTFEGNSRHAYTTRHARGTESYRAPELVRERSIVTKNSDIWALGCILYELAFSKKAFPTDYRVFEYIHSRGKLELDDLPVS